MKKSIIIAVWSLASAFSASAQTSAIQSTTLVLEATIPGKPALSLVVYDQTAGRDFNADGVPDPAFLSKSGVLPQQIEIVDGTNFVNGWIFHPELGDEVLLNLNLSQIVGFIALDPAASLKATLLAERQGRRYVHPVLVDADGSLLWDGSGRVLLAVGDDGAGATDRIVVFDPEIPQIEIWRVEND
jgi:hypothetical protein